MLLQDEGSKALQKILLSGVGNSRCASSPLNRPSVSLPSGLSAQHQFSWEVTFLCTRIWSYAQHIGEGQCLPFTPKTEMQIAQQGVVPSSYKDPVDLWSAGPAERLALAPR